MKLGENEAVVPGISLGVAPGAMKVLILRRAPAPNKLFSPRTKKACERSLSGFPHLGEELPW